MEFLRGVRMRRVRTELLAANTSTRVSEVAARWGFSHAGRFAIQYAKTFGESPSQTLKKSGAFSRQ
jgi:AraC-like DNA-binding protein